MLTSRMISVSSWLAWCGGLNENVLNRFMYLNTWLPVGGAVSGHLEGVAL